MHPQNIVILGTGGTIAGRAASVSDNIGYTAAQVGVEELLAAIPALAQAGTVLTEQVAQVDSKDMSFAVWAKLAARVSHYLAQPDVQGIVITHGTDTLEETAFFLQALLAPAKPVVLTCAMRPATALVPDGPQNLLDAVAVARHAGAQGVVAVCAGVIHGAADVQKAHTYRLDPFSSGDAGPIGYVEEGRLRQLRPWPQAEAGRVQAAAQTIASLTGRRRAPRRNHHEPCRRRRSHRAGPAGAGCAGPGGGRHRQRQPAPRTGGRLAEGPSRRRQSVRASRCTAGRVLPTPADTIPDSEGLSPVKARVQLILQLLA
jgi:L-asparaginase